MNYLEFKRQLMVDPYARSLAFKEAVRTDPDCAAAAAASDKFESALQNALGVAVPEDLLELAIAQRKQSSSGPAQPALKWLPAMAAGLLMGVGLTTAVFVLNQTADEQSVAQHLASHWSKDGDITLQLAAQKPMQGDVVRLVLAGLSLEAGQDLVNSIAYARNCGTPNGNGIHMVINTANGPVTAIYMPDTTVDQNERMQVDSNNVLFAQLQHGSVALIGADQHGLTSGLAMIRANLKEHIET